MTSARTPLPVDMQTLWFLTRAAGLVSLVLLTLTMALGVCSTSRSIGSRHWPRFLNQGLHRNVSLIGLALLVVHIGTAVADDYVSVRLRDVVLPVGGLYRPVWLGAGAAALDVMLLVSVTSIARFRLGHRSWRTIHWAAYAAWTLAVVHGLGTGSDAKLSWALAVQAACVGVVVGAVGFRLTSGWRRHTGWRVAGAAGVLTLVTLVTLWAEQGPLAPGWSHRSGNPAHAASGASR
ncbi:MAG: methionine sulfoxide reductase heme-binding subunit [Frankiales bacterium]|nr:methionine sulfoxide reductase heme-binding subunit [Frankiales bacterium]